MSRVRAGRRGPRCRPVRTGFTGVRRFGDFVRSLGIAKNILNDRLQRLAEYATSVREQVDLTVAVTTRAA